jgi:cytochrome P450
MSNQIQRVLDDEDKIAPQMPQSSVFRTLLTGQLPESERSIARLKGEGQTLIGAGTLTTGHALKTIMFHLLDNPKILERLNQEIDQAFPSKHDQIKLQEAEKLPFLNVVIVEGLRLAYGVTHRLQLISPLEDIVFHGMKIPPGTPVGMTSIFIHDNPAIFPQPRRFDPERWMDPETRVNLSRNFVAFSKGTRMCLGMHLAYAELYLAVATILHRYSLELFETSREDIDMAHDFFDPATKLDSKGLRVKIWKR